MENQRAAKRRREEEAGSIMDDEDRISQLPLHILHHKILSLLPQKDAVQTCILSKSWRHLGPTRPKIEFRESSFRESKEKFISVVENTLHRYDRKKNLSVQEFILEMWPSCGFNNSCWLLNKWIDKLQLLKRLSLQYVWIDDETFENIMLSCPLIQHLALFYCRGLSVVKLNKARALKHLDCRKINSIEINDDAPSLETMYLTSCQNWYLNKNNNFFPRLKSLRLWYVHLRTKDSSLDNFSSNNCPSLEELILHNCSGFTEFKLSSRSIKRLIISISNSNPINLAIIDAANMLYFQFTGRYLPPISLKTTSRECKSHINYVSSSTWPLKLHEFLKALSLSQISLHISYFPLTYQDSAYDAGEPVVVEHLCLREYYSSSQVPDLLNGLFRICRPRYIGLSLNSYSQKRHESQFTESIWKTLVNNGETTKCNFWQQDLEGSSIQVSDKKTNEWHPVQVCAFSNNKSIRFWLKWRDLS